MCDSIVAEKLRLKRGTTSPLETRSWGQMRHYLALSASGKKKKKILLEQFRQGDKRTLFLGTGMNESLFQMQGRH